MNGQTVLRVKPLLAALRCAYPAAEDVLKAVSLGQREREVVARLWVSEGIPFAFRECPALYEEARTWLAEKLGLDPKEISLRGSGRLGYSLNPRRWGEAYDPQSSDLDVFAVSKRLFDGLRCDFKRWSYDYDNDASVTGSKRERQHWRANRQEGPKNIARGLLDSWRVPNRPAYPFFSNTNNRLADLRTKLLQADAGPKPKKKLTLRCYRDWRSYERQASINLKTAADWHRKRV